MSIRKSKTYRARVGCGNLYITIEFNQNATIHKIRIARNSKFKCSLITREKLAKQATFQIRRDPSQLIKDLKGSLVDKCESYNVVVRNAMKKGELAGYSCSDAVANVVEKIIKSNGVEKTEENKDRGSGYNYAVDDTPPMRSLGDLGKL